MNEKNILLTWGTFKCSKIYLELDSQISTDIDDILPLQNSDSYLTPTEHLHQYFEMELSY